MKALPALLALTALAACGSADDSAKDVPVALVKLAPAQQGSVDEMVTIYGQAESGAFGKHVLAAPIEANLVAIDAPVGTQVRAGQVIARLAPSPTSRLDLAKATADATSAQAAFARAQRLRADGLGSDAEVETARAAATGATATRASLAGRAGGLALRAPAAGYVETIGFAPGDLVAAGGTVATVASVTKLRARFGIDPAVVGRVTKGSTLRIATPAGATVPVTIDSVDPVIDATTRLASLFAMIPPGSGIGGNAALTAQVTIGSNGAGGLTIPYAALLDDGGQPYVYVVAGGVAHRRDLAIRPSSGNRVTIVKGLNAGDQVVIEGATALEDGMKVRTK
jgi:RND family efflux transporter MFP subunit